MAKKASKKRQHHSSDRSTTESVKRARTISNGTDKSETLRIQQRIQRAKSVFRGDRDPYFSGDIDEKPSLDIKAWKLRVKVLCSMNDDDDVFRDAVQGLVKICFPKGVIQELEINVLDQHMREGHAPQENISHMRDVFNAEMVHRLAWLLAEHLTTPQLTEVGISSVVAATNRLQGQKFDREVLDDVIFAFQQLRNKLGANDTEGLVNGAGLSMPLIDPEDNDTQDEKEDDEDETLSTIEGGDDSTDESANTLHDQLVAAAVGAVKSNEGTSGKQKLKQRKQKKKSIGARQQNSIDNATLGIGGEGTAVQTEFNPGTQRKTKAKDPNKVSKEWMWDVAADLLVIDDIPVHFKRMGDLFAYHALAAVRSDLGPDARKGKIRKEIERRISEMSEHEYKNWQRSYDKLMNRDIKMLDRLAGGRSCNNNHTAQTARAALRPLSVVKKSSRIGIGRKSKGVDDDSGEEDAITSILPSAQHQVHVKEELYPEVVLTPNTPRHTSEDVPDDAAPSVTASTDQATERPSAVAQRHQSLLLDTPVIDLLWGPLPFQHRDRHLLKEKLLVALDKRVPIGKMPFPYFGGEVRTLEKSTLGTAIDGIIHRHRCRSSNYKLRCRLEDEFKPWVAADPNWWPEVATSEIILMYMMPYITPIVDLLCGSSPNQVRCRYIVQALESRGIDMKETIGTRKVAITNLVNDRCNNPCQVTKRGQLESLLRQIALLHRDKFPELKQTNLVSNWEKMTSLQW